ncbi:MAG: oligopeptidase B, partial [Arsenophonus sp. ET-DL12-MAG3]
KNTSGNIVWANDSHIIYYVRNHPKTLLAYQIYCHYYGKKDIKDKKIYQENDDRFYLSIKKSSSKDYVLICISNTETSEYRLINANNLTETPKIFLARQAGHEYELDHFHDHFYIRSNYQSKQFGLYVTQS